MATATLSLGSNLGDRAENLRVALQKIGELPSTRIVKSSTFHETDPVGGPPQGKFLNAAARLETELEPHELLHSLQKIEREMGRPAEHERWGPRVIDLDLLTYDNLRLNTPELTLPHPRMKERAFVLIPLAEISPEFKNLTVPGTPVPGTKRNHADRPKSR
ncbi:MAG: 2-amino-4-hydroxy-6-hydroxymethyldihydropteridine diphosphokinase [Candidatus Omnitrophota bacterium]|nr:2-amino-4-hydroxy-6-hydroxymethyldihydropteridine diphosphokinase [Candidatus Omnitrophota bacterium]